MSCRPAPMSFLQRVVDHRLRARRAAGACWSPGSVRPVASALAARQDDPAQHDAFATSVTFLDDLPGSDLAVGTSDGKATAPRMVTGAEKVRGTFITCWHEPSSFESCRFSSEAQPRGPINALELFRVSAAWYTEKEGDVFPLS